LRTPVDAVGITRGTPVGPSPQRARPAVEGAATLAARGFVTLLVAPSVVVAGRARQLLLAIVLFDIPLQIDKNFSYLDGAAEFGAIGGFSVSFTTLALAALYAGWFLERLARRDRTPMAADLAPLGAYFAVTAMSLFVARDVGLYARGLFLFAQMFLLYVYLVGTIRSRHEVRFVVMCLLCGLVLEGTIIALAAIGHDVNVPGLRARIDVAADDVSGSRSGGTVGSPNNAAEYLEMLLPVAAALLGSRLGRSWKAIAALGLALGSAALVATLSRGGWIATVLALSIVSVAMWRRGRLSRAVPWLAGLILAIGLMFHGSIAQRLTEDDAGSAHVRVPLMETAFRIIADNPMLGVGANNYTAALPEYASRHQDEFLYAVHNQYLLVCAETGIAGLAAFLWFLLAAMRQGLEVWKRGDALLAPLALGFTAALIGQAMHMQVDLFNSRPQLQLLVTVAALVAVMSRIQWAASPGRPFQPVS
jgi:hypothetical protein